MKSNLWWLLLVLFFWFVKLLKYARFERSKSKKCSCCFSSQPLFWRLWCRYKNVSHEKSESNCWHFLWTRTMYFPPTRRTHRGAGRFRIESSTLHNEKASRTLAGRLARMASISVKASMINAFRRRHGGRRKRARASSSTTSAAIWPTCRPGYAGLLPCKVGARLPQRKNTCFHGM